MSIFDLPASGSSGASGLQQSGPGWLTGGGGSSGGVPTTPPTRGFPERLDANTAFSQGMGALGYNPQPPDALQQTGLNIAQVAGQGPGFVAERIPALITGFLGMPSRPADPNDPTTRFGYGTILDPIAQGIGTVLGFSGEVRDGIVNATTAEELQLNYGRPSGDPALRGIDVAGSLFRGLTGGGFGGPGTAAAANPQTVQQLFADAAARGFTAADVQGLVNHTRLPFDFAHNSDGQRIALDANPVTDAALSLGTDPLNVLLGAGLIGKAWQSAGLVARLVRTGELAIKPLNMADGAAAVLTGSADAARILTSRALGATFVKYAALARAPINDLLPGALNVGRVGRLTLGQAYWRASLGIAAGEVGGTALLDAVTPSNGPQDGWLEGLRRAGQSLIDNRPLSGNAVFSLYSAFRFPLHDYLAAARGAATDVRLARFGHRFDTAIIEAIAPSNLATLVEKRAYVTANFGLDRVARMRTYALENIIMDPANKHLPPQVIEGFASASSNAERVLAHENLATRVQSTVGRLVAENRIRPSQVVQTIKDWQGEQGGYLDKTSRFAWNGPRAMADWTRFEAGMALVQPVLRATGRVTIGLSHVLHVETIDNAIGELRAIAGDAKVVPIENVRDILARYPQIVDRETSTSPYFERLGAESAPRVVPLRSMVDRLNARKKTAPSFAESAAPFKQWEASAPPDVPAVDGPVNTDGTINTNWASPIDEASIVSTRFHDTQMQRLGAQPTTVAEAQSLRLNPVVRDTEAHIAEDLTNAGFNAARIVRTVEGFEGVAAPGIHIVPTWASPAEQRIIAALVGDSRRAGTVTMTVPANQLAAKGLHANGVQFAWHVDLADTAVAERVNAVLRSAFPEYSIGDATGRIEVNVKTTDLTEATMASVEAVNAGLLDIYGADAIGKPNFVESANPAYIEVIGKGAKADVSYESILRAAHNDPRLIEFRRLQSARPKPTGGPAVVPGEAVAGQGLSGQPAADAGPVDLGQPAGGVAAQLPLPFDATGEMHAVHAVIEHAADPNVPALQTTLRAMGDLHATNNDWGQVLWDAHRDTQVGRELPMPKFDPRLGTDPQFTQTLAELEKQLQETSGGAYTLVSAPKNGLFLDPKGDTTLAGALRMRTKTGDWLDRHGPTSAMMRWLEWATAPQNNSVLGRAARAALVNEVMTYGGTGKQVARWYELMRQHVEEGRMFSGRHSAKMYRGPMGLPPGTINGIAVKAFGPKVAAAIGEANFWKLLDRASNSFMREHMLKGYQDRSSGWLGRALAKVYVTQQDTIGAYTRYIGKTLYPQYRFMADPRWWAMNYLEADALGIWRHGFQASRVHGAHSIPMSSWVEKHAQVGPAQDTGLAFTRERAGFITRSMEVETRGASQGVIDALLNDAGVRGTPAQVRSQLLAIENTVDAMPAKDFMVRQMVRDFGPSPETWSKELDRMLYNFDSKGVQATAEAEAAQLFSEGEQQRYAPLIDKLWRQNQASMDAIVGYYHGNNSRANWERIANSYWLYWPISYQLKAAKWLFDGLTKGVLGYKTNMLGAAAYDQLMQMHQRRMATDAAYAQTFIQHPTLWGIAQMLLPITPFDLGVSLNRPIRYAGGALGLWGAYKQAQDPITAAAGILTMGPTYTIDLLGRLAREAFK